ncbi:Chromosome segregation protein (Spc25, Csm1, Pcs1) [Halococcus morrhuae DSM 1307]|uniref:Chromosome segregation protein (Spc25, Csm1, Pcs1) n=1 Tax=Halococcus morrhuae DSM 1307 TaxID=931277 RepID=M0M4L4_HALMO|nr:archaea-specific SMC-related protein [Halococcus morrhuae]EMA40757.1 Chromosome segregation protein (Spc25, Csm1, Pcs1) [Halococcus morrhuae DSM 1307]
MSAEELAERDIHIHVENVGGIDRTDVETAAGVTVLTGRNATNRTSLLQAVMAGLGSDSVSLKGDADEGTVELSIGDDTYTRTLTRENGVVATDGEPYLDDPTVADLFAFLLESNEARRAVARSDDLRDLIMRPIDTDVIRAEISDLEDRRRELDDQLEELDALQDGLPDLEAKRRRLDEKIEDKRDALEAKEAELDDADRDVDETREEKAELEDTLDELRRTRSELENVRYDIDTHEESVDALHDERAELEADYDELPDAPAGERSELDAEIERLRERESSLESELSELQSIVQFNEDMLDGDDVGRLDSLNEGSSDGDDSVTDQLVADETVTCWTCGSDVDADQIEATLDRLRSLRQETLADVNDVREELDELVTERNALDEKQQQRDRLERRLDRIEGELDDHETTLDDLAAERDALTDEIETLETEVEQLENEEYTELLDLHKEANQLEFELGRVEGDREEVVAEIADIEERLDERDRLEGQRADVQDELEELRTRIERIETEAVEGFNDHMATVLDLLDYENIERIWIERVEQTVREGRRKVDKSVFELHVVRTTQSGTAYEDTIDHLSESEREVTGLVFALAGYLVHDLHETVPVMLLDSLEAVDSDRIARLVDYFAEYPDYLVVALLPDDAAALDDDYERVTEI